MGRLKSFDYKSPYFYMVTLKRLPNLAAFSEIGPSGIVENAITRAFNAVIRGFHNKWRSCEEISPFIVMPDHLHLLIKIRDIPERVALGRLVYPLEKALAEAYWRVVGADETAPSKTPSTTPQAAPAPAPQAAPAPAAQAAPTPAAQAAPTPAAQAGSASGGFVRPIFEKDWHDWVVKRQGQLAAFRRYIKENARRAWLRRQNARFFGRITTVDFLGRRWFSYGNRAILDLPVLAPFKGHRATRPDSPEWLDMLESASRIGPGGAGVSTFMSPLEKACGDAIYKAGGKLVMLCPEGFGPRWHPTREKERLCAQGRMLFLSLYEARASQPTRQELYARCHEMVDLALANLSPATPTGLSPATPANLSPATPTGLSPATR